MSDVMLCGVLRMPYELWKDDPLQVPQVLARMREAALELEKRAAEIERLRALVKDLADDLEGELRGHRGPTMDYPSDDEFERGHGQCL